MDNFEKKIKQLAKQEKINVPVNYNDRVDTLLKNISTTTKRTKKRTSIKILVSAAVLTVLTTASVLAAPIISDMAGGVISYFNKSANSNDFKYLSQKATFEKFNSKVGASVTDNGIKLTIDNIAVDDNYINVFYTVTSNSPFKIADDNDSNVPLNWRINSLAPVFSFKAGGKFIEPATNIDVEVKIINETTLSGMHRFSLIKSLTDKFNLEIYTNRIANTEGTWYFPLTIDKITPKSETMTVTPNLKATVTTGIRKKYTHEISIDKVSISPFGSKIDIIENTKSNNFFDKFVLISDTGKYLNIIGSDSKWEDHDKYNKFGSTRNSTITTSFEFMGGTTDIKSIKLLPFSVGVDSDGLPPPKLISKPISSGLPISLEQSKNGTIVIDSIETTRESAIITIHTEGVVFSPSIVLLDENGEQLNMDIFTDNAYNRKTYQTILTYRFKNASEQDITKIKKLGTFTQTIEVNEAEAITIPLK